VLNVLRNDSNGVYRAKTSLKQNPKSEYRNPKQTNSQINPKSKKFQNPEFDASRLEHCSFFDHLELFRISDFEFRVFSASHSLAAFASLREL